MASQYVQVPKESKSEGRRRKRDERRQLEGELLAFLEERAEDEGFVDRARDARRAATAMAREAVFVEKVREVVEKVLPKLPRPKPYRSRKSSKPVERILNVLESDLHFGSMLDPAELPVRYGFAEEARRLAAVTVQAVDYKRQYRDETRLYVHLLGDIIQNQLHDPRDGAPLAEQVGDALWLLDQQVSLFSAEFREVDVFTNPGNHGRNKARHMSRATCEKWDAVESTIYAAIQTAARRYPNVQVHLTRRPYYTVQAFDKRGFFTHGDTVLNPGNPNKTINVKSIINQTNELNAAAASIGEAEYDLFAVGHVHFGSMLRLPGGAAFMTNGPLVPTDAFAVSIGSLRNQCSQWMWESTPGYIVGDTRDALVSVETDKDKSLDKVIKPYPGFGR